MSILLRTRCLLLLCCFVVACGSSGGDAPPGRPGAGKGGPGGPGRGGPPGAREAVEPLLVAATQPTRADLVRYYRSSGTLRAHREADIRPLQSGVVTELRAEEGMRVKENDVLARIDSSDARLQTERDALALSNAQAELERLRSIAELDVIPREEFDRQQFAVKSAKATQKLSRNQLAQRLIRAPFDGMITSRAVDIGNMAGSSTTIFHLADISTLELDLFLPEIEAAAVTQDTAVELELVDGTKFTASVLRKAPIVDAATGTVKITCKAQDYPAQAMPGAFVRAAVEVAARPNAVSLPATAIVEVEGKPHVMTVVDGTTRRIAVEIGLRAGERVELLTQLPESTVVLSEPGDLNQGQAVRVAGVPEKAGAPLREHKAGDDETSTSTSHAEAETATASNPSTPPASSPAKPRKK